ncbi:MAG: amidinotransferase [Thermoproteota archaeon]|nr:MAG: amidinotransferase [Candidatus Korarchaeota archaeon]
MPKRAIVREPSKSYASCISSHPLRHTIDLPLARKQHEEYCKTLLELGLELIRLPRDDKHPDSCFVEDNAVVHGRRALICRMARESRKGEEEAVMEVLRDYMPVKRAVPPATIEGGDIIHLENCLICGVTQRTNIEGVNQLKEWFDVEVKTVFDRRIVHLKSYVSYLGRGFVISTKRYADHPALKGLKVLVIPEDESYAANALAIDDVVLMPKGFPKSEMMVREAGYEVITLDVSEFQKCEGALTCLSILF